MLKELFGRRELLAMLVSRNIKIRYKNSVLGFFWTLLGPIFLILIYGVFLGLLKIEIPLPLLVISILVWQFLASCLGDSLNAILGSSNLVTKTAFPRASLPVSIVLANLVNFALTLLVLVPFLVFYRSDFGALYWLPLIVLTNVVLCIGFSLIVSVSNVFLRDTEHILSVVMLAWFFLSPVVYPMSLLAGYPSWTHVVYFLNPMSGLIVAYRNVFTSLDYVSPWLMMISFSVCWLIGLLGAWVFHTMDPKLGDEL